MKKLSKPRLPRRKKSKKPLEDGSVPRITNETVAETREEVLKGARKLIYPLQHSKHRVVRLSIIIALAVVIGFFSYSTVSLYRHKNTSTFMYRVTQIVPFPVAKVGNSFVAYEDYLFELRQYVHYFTTQENIDFESDQGKAQLEEQRKEALKQVINKAYIKKLAKEKGITVSAEEIDAEIELLRSQNRLGSDESALQDVIRDYYGWTINDFRRSLKDKILQAKVLEALDTDTTKRAETAKAELDAGKDFAAVAQAYSDDLSTKDNGGEIPFLIDKQDRNVPIQMTEQLFALKPGEVSGIFSVGYGLEIIKHIETKDGKIRAAYILFNRKDIQEIINVEKEKTKATTYLRL